MVTFISFIYRGFNGIEGRGRGLFVFIVEVFEFFGRLLRGLDIKSEFGLSIVRGKVDFVCGEVRRLISFFYIRSFF